MRHPVGWIESWNENISYYFRYVKWWLHKEFGPIMDGNECTSTFWKSMVNKIFSAFVTQKVSQAKRFSYTPIICCNWHFNYSNVPVEISSITFKNYAGLSTLFEKIVLGIKKNFSKIRGLKVNN
jgi:hypothetical protein